MAECIDHFHSELEIQPRAIKEGTATEEQKIVTTDGEDVIAE